jgi:hypothetical protein
MQKTNWSDPAMRARLAEAYAVAGGDDEKAAHPRRESGSARLAKRRHWMLRPLGVARKSHSGPQAMGIARSPTTSVKGCATALPGHRSRLSATCRFRQLTRVQFAV